MSSEEGPGHSSEVCKTASHSRNLQAIGDFHSDPSSSSPEYGPNDEKKVSKTPISESQKLLASQHGGLRCIVTNSNTAIQTCHLVARSTDPSILMHLEYAWGGELDLESCHNIFFACAKWHDLFIHPHPQWMLIPQLETLKRLQQITSFGKRKRLSMNDRARVASNLCKYFENKEFVYHLLPTQKLHDSGEPICRYEGSNADLEIHAPPFTTLGPIMSHIHPHYVVVDAAQKILELTWGDVIESRLAAISGGPVLDAIQRCILIEELYEAWTKTRIPSEFGGWRSSQQWQ